MLIEALGPSKAEAKISGTPEAMDLVRDLWSAAEVKRSQYLPDMYSRIYRAAEAKPEEVFISPRQDILKRGSLGEYQDYPHRILYVPNPPKDVKYGVENTIPHELVHFLNATSDRPQNVGVQHDLIYELIGGAFTNPGVTGAIPGAPPRAMTPMQRAILEKWFGQKETER